MTTKLTAKEQYRLALQCIRFVRAYNRERADGIFAKAVNIEVIRETLHYSIERQVFDAAVKTLVQKRYDDIYGAHWTMSNRLLVTRKHERLDLDTWPMA